MIVISCQKDKDQTYPEIIINQPFENKYFDVFDTVFISAIVSDENKIEKIEIGLADENFIPLLRTYDFDVKNNPQNILFEYPINDKSLKTGDYYIFIRAFDGSNIKHKYRKIRILEIPKEYLGLILIAKNQNFYYASSINSQNNIENSIQFDSDSIFSVYNSLENQFAILGKNKNNFEVYSYPNFVKLWGLENLSNPPFPYFTALNLLDNMYYLSYYTGEVKSFRSMGQAFKSYNILDSYYSVNTNLFNDLLIFEELKISNNFKRLGFFSYSGGGWLNNFQHQYEIEKIFKKSSNELVIFSSQNSESQIRIFELDVYNSWTHKTLAGTIVDAAQIDSDNYFFCTSSKLYWYKYSTSNLVAVANLANAKSLSYDEVNHRIIVGHNNKIEFFSIPNANSLGSFMVIGDLHDFHIVYNK